MHLDCKSCYLKCAGTLVCLALQPDMFTTEKKTTVFILLRDCAAEVWGKKQYQS